MSNKISDFILAANYIKILCQKNSCDFVDLNVVFDSLPVTVGGNDINVGKTKTLGQTTYNIISTYAINSKAITGKEFFDHCNGHINIAVVDTNKNESNVNFTYNKTFDDVCQECLEKFSLMIGNWMVDVTKHN